MRRTKASTSSLEDFHLKLELDLFENSIRIQILLQIMTGLQVELLEPLSLARVYSVAVGVSVRGVLSYWLVSSMSTGAFS